MSRIAAQVSIYPLRQESLTPAIERALEIFQEHALETKPGPMSTLILGEDLAVFTALWEAFHSVGEHGQVVMQVAVSNACPVG